MSVSELSEQLVKTGCAVDVFTTTANGQNELDVIAGQPVIIDNVWVTYFKRLSKDHTHFSPALLRAIWNRAKTYDIIHIHAWWNLVSVFSCFIALIKGVPVLVSPRGTLSNYSFSNNNIIAKKLLHKMLGAYLLKNAHIHTTSKAEHDHVLEIIKPKSISIIPNFVKLPEQKYAVEKRNSAVFKLLFFSRIEHKKGLDLLIDALPGLTIPYTLTIAGKGQDEYVAQLKVIAEKNGSDKYITWAGFQNEDKFNMLNAHDLMVLPSYDENFGNVVIESLGVGTAVVISDKVGLADYIQSKSLGWLCETTAASVSWVINNIAKTCQSELDNIRLNAPAIINNDFYEAVLVKSYTDRYRQIIEHEF